jgi:hypothetical protein
MSATGHNVLINRWPTTSQYLASHHIVTENVQILNANWSHYPTSTCPSAQLLSTNQGDAVRQQISP